VCTVSDLLSEMSNVEIGSGNERNTKPNTGDIGRQDVSSIRSRIIDNADDDDNDAFSHSDALTITSSQQSPDGLFNNVSSVLGHGTDSTASQSYTQQSAERPCVELAISNSSDNVQNNSSCNPRYVGHFQQSADSPDGCKVMRGNDAASDLRIFLMDLGLGKYADVFYEQDVDLSMFLTLNEDDLKEIGIR